MQIQFIGAAGTVTGSKYLVRYDRYQILIDCGLFQGVSELKQRNWDALPFEASQINAVLLTHAHIDHSGFLPALMKRGFRGSIYTSKLTHHLCKVLLPDAGFLQEEDARYANKKKYSKHDPAEPLYTEDDAREVLKQFKNVREEETLELPGGLTAVFTPVGHILGACSIRLEYQGKSVTFSGDVGRCNDPIMYPPKALKATDYLIVESTYGDRLHPEIDAEKTLADIINRTIKRGGIVLMPAFAVGRAQLILYYLSRLIEKKQIPAVPIFLNSPMTIRATQIFMDAHEQHKLNQDDCELMDEVTTYVKTTEESMALTARKEPCLIISASGMASGGRVLHHLKALVSNPRNCILFMGFQAPGTRGFSLVNGAEKLRIHGEEKPVLAEVINLDSLSSHADFGEMLRWLKQMPGKPKKVFVTHGEEDAARSLQQHLQVAFEWNVEVASYLQKVDI
ncbi:MAG: hypothetical protein RL217_294 [Pseudomonadota bacterium]|jgi:metallo-beta-lactamase family protein